MLRQARNTPSPPVNNAHVFVPLLHLAPSPLDELVLLPSVPPMHPRLMPWKIMPPLALGIHSHIHPPITAPSHSTYSSLPTNFPAHRTHNRASHVFAIDSTSAMKLRSLSSTY
ncbi:hypothetical protein GOP47_0011108 [Adiantum capillus-veneris]|uniref:Uncharacterized protein n=1 Tax=Adiantum capillus-veneris TaxID=13818 RepID=A0A9D4US65_ADICA|nr:hypothetical protein GOP47_0011108 [Adiantum capillus-veneris]